MYSLVVFLAYSEKPKDHFMVLNTSSEYRDTLESFIMRNGHIWFSDNLFYDYKFKVRLTDDCGNILFFYNPFDPSQKKFYFNFIVEENCYE